ncbi:ribonuclease HI [Bacteroidota bacterium]
MGPDIIIYTDGAARGNPGPGGYGIVLQSGKHRKEISEGFRLTTNNRMELLAVIVAIESLKVENSVVTLYTDSKYVADAVEKRWLFEWEKKNFKKKKNPDLWKRFLKIYYKHKIKFVWIKGHAQIPENEICDQLAVNASNKSRLLVDEGYEESIKPDPALDFNDN